MTTIAAVLGVGDLASARIVERMLDAAWSADASRELRTIDGAVISSDRFEWEKLSTGSTHILETRGLLIAADASLHYRDDLRQALAARGVVPRGDSPAHLIAAAYDAWGKECADHLEGDFAFVLWDSRQHVAICARDTSGRKTLYYAVIGETLVVASSIAGVRAHPKCPDALNLPALGAQAAGMLFSAGTDTCLLHVNALRAGRTLTWTTRDGISLHENWQPPALNERSSLGFDAAADELRSLLVAAVAERMSLSHPTAVWMSGGYDSTAVFAAGREAMRIGRATGELLPVSMSYPEGDVGREDELIEAVAAHWNTPVRWVRVDDVDLLSDLETRAGSSDQPPAHLYEPWNMALAHATRAMGSHTALDGCGGDNLFQVSDIYFADLLHSGRLLRFMRELRAKRVRGRDHFVRFAVKPLLPELVIRALARRHGDEPIVHYMERRPPVWVRTDFVRQHGLMEREREHMPTRNTRHRADAENRFFVLGPPWSYGGGYMARPLAGAGLDAMSPLLDRRIIQFALRRPVSERASPYETKSLLRRAMRGLLPDSILAPRRYRTGTTVGFSQRQMLAGYPPLFRSIFARPMILESMGVVDASSLRKAAEHYLLSPSDQVGIPLFHTIKTELWLRAQRRSASASAATSDRAMPLVGV
jgi:asparagine synthase (glutamine-hydrolysing)